ncbi:UDP-4-amino-4-deoxy-L-arabinose--oxoglutarate aminotransferase [Chitinispirillum alkaliphilum]|nr:UDP-4-amino-4-deoxy-L-arabinose--oxoglutarate aminotransferase [Chitinispirillum alkaliphilum]
MDNVAFMDLKALHGELEDEILEIFRESMSNAQFIGGPLVEEFEDEFARFCSTRYSVGVGSGTDALRFALMAAGVGAGDMVITVPNTFIATTEAITQAGAIPVFIDVDERTACMSPEKLREYLDTHCYLDSLNGVTVSKITHKPVRAVVPVHLYGQPADMDPILDIAQRNHLLVVEDACQAHGAEYFSQKHQSWLKAGSMGNAAAFSFYPGKNLGAFGEAGAVTTNDEQLSKTVRMLRDHGQTQKYVHKLEGYNGRLDSIQAGVLLVKLRHLKRWNELRRECAAHYSGIMCSLEGIQLPYEPIWARSVYHLYVIQTPFRDRLQNSLSRQGIGTGLHYPIPLHLQNAYSVLGCKEGSFPVSEKLSRGLLSLPMHPFLSKEQQQKVSLAIGQFLQSDPSGLDEGELVEKL